MRAIGSRHSSPSSPSSYTDKRMKLSELECFLEVAKQGNMTVAAKVLHIGQATVSERMQQLEANLGVVLFERSPP